MYDHMTREHFHCGLCARLGAPHVYLRDAARLRAHYASAHHACEEPECAEGMVAFGTAEELRCGRARWEGGGSVLVLGVWKRRC